MIRDVHFSQAIFMKLKPLVERRDLDNLLAELDGMSNSQFRTAGYILGERLALELENEDFWELFAKLVSYNNKAFLVTMLKAFCERINTGLSSVYDKGFKSFCSGLSDVDKQKTLQHLLPVLGSHEDIINLFSSLRQNDRVGWLPYLLKTKTIPSYFVLFSSLRYIEEDRPYLIRIASYLVKQGDSVSFNLASLMKAYFGLDEIKSTFSLNLKPYQLSRLENTYEAFADTMNS